jgi:hypothetical protein
MIKKFIQIVFISVFASVFSVSTGVTDEINKAFKTSDSALLKKHMNTSVELVILEKENVYSNIQAEQILKQFFAAHPVTGFEILHKGDNQKSQYFIGSLKTKTEVFRVYYLIKYKDETPLIYQLRIESDE